MARGLELLERVLRVVERGGRFVEPALLEQGTAEHELCVADLVEPVLAVAQERQRVTRLLFGGL